MIEFFSKIFIKDYDNFSSPAVRKAYGILCSAWGIVLNMLLFVFKLIAGTVSGSVAVSVDAIHNLTDSASSAVTLLSFLLSGQKKTKKFPLGKGRIEYIAGFLIAVVLISAGAQLAKASVLKIITPEPVTFSMFSVSLLAISVLTKFYMAAFNTKYGRKISSAALKASATDCLADSFSTLIAAFAVIAVRFTSLNIDAWGGLAVSLFILYAGCKAAKDTVKMLIGMAPDEEIIKETKKIITDFPQIKQIDNIVLHDYGPDSRILTIDTHFTNEVLLSDASEITKDAADRIKTATGCQVQMILCN